MSVYRFRAESTYFIYIDAGSEEEAKEIIKNGVWDEDDIGLEETHVDESTCLLDQQ